MGGKIYLNPPFAAWMGTPGGYGAFYGIETNGAAVFAENLCCLPQTNPIRLGGRIVMPGRFLK